MILARRNAEHILSSGWQGPGGLFPQNVFVEELPWDVRICNILGLIEGGRERASLLTNAKDDKTVKKKRKNTSHTKNNNRRSLRCEKLYMSKH